MKPSARLLRLALPFVLVGVAACSKGTFLILDFTTDSASPVTGVASIHVDLSMNGQTAKADFPGKNGSISFPTSASIEIGSGEGTMTITATAKDSADKVVAMDMNTVTFARNDSPHVSFKFASTPIDTGDLTIAPKTYDFGTALVGQMGGNPTKDFVVTNNGTQTTGSLMAMLSGTDMMDFFVDNAKSDCFGAMLPPSGTCTVTVGFGPKSAGSSKAATIRVLSPTGTPGGSVSAMLTGKAGAPGSLKWDQTSYTFPSTFVSTTGGMTVFTLSNMSMTPTSVISIALNGTNKDQFQILAGQDNCTGTSLPSNGTCTVKVQSAPTQRATMSATLDAVADTGGLATVMLSGKGIIHAKLTIVNAYMVGAPFDLGTVDVGQTGGSGQGNSYTFMVRNDGDEPTGALMLDTTPPMAEITALSGTTCNPGPKGTLPYTQINPNDTCTAVIALKPTIYGKKDASLDFSASPGGTASTYVTGIGHDQVILVVSATSTDGATGTITDTAVPNNLDCSGVNPGSGTCQATFDRTTSDVMYTMQAIPDGGSYSLFKRWTQMGIPCAGGSSSADCALDLDASVAPGTYNFTAAYNKQLFTVTYNRIDLDRGGAPGFGGNGHLGALSSSNGYSCAFAPCATTSEQVPGGTNLVVSADVATSPAGKTLRRIDGPCTARSNDSTTASCNFTVSGDVTVNVVFSAQNFAFVTSNAYDSNLKGAAASGLQGANQICQAEADAANMPGTFHAYLSTSTIDAKQQLGTANGWLRQDFKPFSRSNTDLTTNHAVLYPLVLDATGGSQEGVDVFTSTGQDGNANLTGGDACADWTDDTSTGQLSLGRAGSSSPEWLEAKGGALCGTPAHLYCFGVDLNTPMLNPPTMNLRMAFVTSGTFTPGGAGLANADALCTAAKNTNPNISSKQFKAFMSGDTVANGGPAAAGRFPNSGAPWARLDGVLIAQTITDLMGTPMKPIAALNLTENGTTYLTGYNRVWTGAPDAATSPFAGDNCSGWSTTAGSGWTGYTFRADQSLFGDNVSLPLCTNAFNVYCLESQ